MCYVLNMSGFGIFQDCQYARVLNFQGYTWFTYFQGSDMRCDAIIGRVLSIPGFRIFQVAAHATLCKVLNMLNIAEKCLNKLIYDWVLNMPDESFTGL